MENKASVQKKLMLDAFKQSLTNDINQNASYATSDIDTCYNILKTAIETVTEKELTSDDVPTIKAIFTQSINNLADNKTIKGKAAFYSKKAFEAVFSKNLSLKSKNEVPAHFKDKANLQKVYQETQKYAKTSNQLDPKITKKMIKGTCIYRTRTNGNLLKIDSVGNKTEKSTPSLIPETQKKVQTTYQIFNQDSFMVAQILLKDGYLPVVLTMANKISIGGGVEHGSIAQEEDLYRCSNYFEATYPWGTRVTQGRHKDRLHYNKPIPEFGSYYTPDVQVFRSSVNNYAFINPFAVSCIAIAGYDLAKPESFEKTLRDQHGNPLTSDALMKAFKEGTKRKIRHLLEVAILHGHDSLILGAISCGAFKLPGDTTGKTATVVADACQEVLEEPAYQNRFKRVAFAVLGGVPGSTGELNYKIFDTMVQKLNAKQPNIEDLINAINKGDTNEVKNLIQKIDVNTKTSSNQSALHFASLKGTPNSEEYVKLLVEANANCYSPDGRGSTPIQYAIASENEKVLCYYLIKHLIKVEDVEFAKQHNKDTVLLTTAMRSHHTAALANLLQLGLNPNKVLPNQQTALHIASLEGTPSSIELIKCLLDNNANAHAEDGIKWTPVQYAIYSKNVEAIKVYAERKWLRSEDLEFAEKNKPEMSEIIKAALTSNKPRPA